MQSKLLTHEREKTYALVFDTGEEVAEGLLEFAREQGLTPVHLRRRIDEATGLPLINPDPSAPPPRRGRPVEADA